MQLADLAHHRLVDRGAARSVDDQHVLVVAPRVIERALRDIDRLLADRRGKEIGLHLPRERLQLLDCRGPVNVAAREQDFLLVLLLQEFRELAARRRLAAALEARHQHDCRRLGYEIERVVVLAHERRQLAMHDADYRLSGRQAPHDLLPERFVANSRDEIAHHGERDVGLEQRHAHFAQRVSDVVLGDARFAAQRLENTRKPRRQVIEHWGYTRRLMEILAYVVNALLYGALAIYFWRTRWSAARASTPGHDAPAAAEHYAVLVPVAMHAVLLGRSLFAPDGLHLGLGNA